LLVSEWANEKRVLSRRASAEPGRFRWQRAPYQREWLDAVIDDGVEEVVLMTASQVGKTEVVNNVLGYFIDQDPSPILVVLPTVDLAEAWSKDRLAPMLEETPALAEKVSEAKSRDSDNTILHKAFPGGHISAVGANAPSSLAMRPIRILLCDEVDRFPASAGTEGDPIALAARRTDTFWNRRKLYTSTPTTKGVSRIEQAFEESDQRRYHVPCPKCRHMQVLRWDRVMFEKDENGLLKPESVVYRCEACGVALTERDKAAMLDGGKWVAQYPERRARGYHLNALYSPWRTWADIAEEWTKVGKNPERLKVFVNTVLAETWEEKGDGVKAERLRDRLEQYDAEVPDGVGIIVASVDTQGDRLEVAVVGFGEGEQSWLVAFSQIHGDPAGAKVWSELTTFLDHEFECASKQKAKVELAVVDSGGAHTDEVYKYCNAMLAAGRRVYPVKGGSIAGRPLVERPTATNKYHVPLFVLCVDSGKETVLARLQVPAPGAGYVHLPHWVDDEFLEQLTAEKAVKRYVKGRGAVREWVKTRERNEAFDLMVYALAALRIAGAATIATLGERAARLSVRVEAEEAKAEAGAGDAGAGRAGRPLPRPSWVNSWRR
jgi:phage terminase large subunit GpA-like protein